VLAVKRYKIYALVMAALWNSHRAGHYIFVPWFLFFLLLLLFSSPISAVADWMSTIPLHMVWQLVRKANLECRSEMCCTRLAGNAGTKKSPKIGRLGNIAQLRRAISSQLRHASTIGKKLVKQQYLLHMSLQYGELRPSSG